MGSAQRFGVPLFFGGPQVPRYMATRDEHRATPARPPRRGSIDSRGGRAPAAWRRSRKPAEQHIRRRPPATLLLPPRRRSSPWIAATSAGCSPRDRGLDSLLRRARGPPARRRPGRAGDSPATPASAACSVEAFSDTLTAEARERAAALPRGGRSGGL
ncbi:MAG: hypothetical protein U5L11_15325 [Arhodomonas sp.]|nr:hypothetical protein [Arhodomonas sp.]